MVSQVEGNRAHVDPDPGVSDTIKSKLGWGDADEESYPIDESDIQSIDDDEVQLNR
ncbi:MAG: PRC-barrel domain containing protein [Halorubrum sp.]